MCNPPAGTIALLFLLAISLGVVTVMVGPFELLSAIEKFVNKYKIIFWILGILGVIVFATARKIICGG